MKKLALNKTTIANLDSPEKIVGGVTHSFDGNTIPILSCAVITCARISCNECMGITEVQCIPFD